MNLFTYQTINHSGYILELNIGSHTKITVEFIKGHIHCKIE